MNGKSMVALTAFSAASSWYPSWTHSWRFSGVLRGFSTYQPPRCPFFDACRHGARQVGERSCIHPPPPPENEDVLPQPRLDVLPRAPAESDLEYGSLRPS